MSPRLTEWLPDLLEKLTPHTERAIRDTTTTEDRWRASSQFLTRLHPEWSNTDNTWTDDVAEAVAYVRAITARALTYDTDTEPLSAYHHQRHANLSETVTAIGTGRGPVNASLGALAKGPVALHRELDAQPTVLILQLDGEAWTEVDDRRTGVRALAAIAVLAAGFDVRVVVSPALHRHLSRRYPNWTEYHLGLTGSRDRSPHTTHREQTPEAAWDVVRDLDTEPGKRRLLGNLTTTHARRYDDLSADDAIDIAAGTVSRYVLDLETRGLVTVNRRGTQHTVQLTDLGQRATRACLDDDYELIHPDQRRLDERLTPTPHYATSTVSPRRPGGPEATPPDEWVAATGTPDTAADYVQWLTGPNSTPASRLHDRFATVAHDDAITLVGDQPATLEDGRVAYLSHTETETLVVLQWGGPVATLGRLAGALLSEKALSQILTPERLGHKFEALDEDTHEYAVGRLLRRGRQVGWCSDAETTYEAWRERITTVRDRLLSRVAELTENNDTAARSELFKDLHGLIASATQLYHAAGIDLTTTLRVPDTATLARSTTRLQNLCKFLAKTVPKQSTYGIHSGYRLLFEDRPTKLCRRLPYEVEPDAQLDLTMSWVIAGPTATALHDEITTALREELATVRDAVADGTEAAPTLEIPVVDGTTYPAIRRVIDEIATAHNTQWSPREKQRLVRLCLRSFGPSETTRRACPYDVVVSLLWALSEAQTPTPADVERAAATLPATRFRPKLTPTATKLYATLLQADGSLGRTALIEQADISASSYDRRLEDVQALDRVHAVQIDGHRRWTTMESVSLDQRIPPVTAWLPYHSDQPATSSSTHRQSPTSTRPSILGPAHTWWRSRAGWDRRPPISIATVPIDTAHDTMCPILMPTDSRQPHSHDQSHPQPDIMTPPTTPTTVAATPQPTHPNGGTQQ
ncbi:plasmid replication protein RepH [Halorubrum tebenquichense DSM 14210]|uniref:Plasmid replication protein RepH n=1 Tax=Halorubrum tebenquichense DSM 14210 TaxID=1227485 RepID=M0DV80_9EURY|nr:plasmid replication protein RepH [Halorubrum tebenquichense DSM 14210]